MALVVAYDGTQHAGWQLQPNAPTIQGELERALGVVHGVDERVSVVGAGRTDAGVHALGQVASYRQPTLRRPDVLARALDALLPEAIRVLTVVPVHASFHACRSAREKTYVYRVVNRAQMLPFEARYAWHVRGRIDLSAAREAAASLVGRHDFAAFASAGGQSESTVRDLRRLEVRACDGDVVEIEARADGFLYRMVRNLTGFLVEVGLGRRPARDAARVLATARREEAGVTAPARGLCLVRVAYDVELGFEVPRAQVLHSDAEIPEAHSDAPAERER
jgi:tRNA pseudouridine38-40 synthase